MSPSPAAQTRIAPAKVNLGLHVLRRRPDGYHDLDTVFLPIPWHDVLKAHPAETLVLTCSDARLPTDASNLVLQAAQLLRQARGVAAGAHLHLEKHLPFGAGLGGGSSDAAAALLLLRDLWHLEVSAEALHTWAARLGADVAFFLERGAARGTGRGDVLTPLYDADGDPFVVPYPLVVVVPSVHVSTAEAYGCVTARAEGRPDLVEVVRSLDLDRWRAELVNDFEAPIVAAHPVLEAVRAALHDAGARYVSMSGSGSAFYGFFERDAAAQAAAEALRYEGHTVWHGYAPAA